MPVRREIPYNEGLFFITFTCYQWIRLKEITNSYDLIYEWFDYLKTQSHRITGYVIMPNHVHVMINFSKSEKRINKIIGDEKRFIAYSIIERLTINKNTALLDKLQKAVTATSSKRGKKHEIWEESFVPIIIGRKFCETAEFAYQKLIYMHNNPCAGKWMLAKDAMAYEHSSVRYYISGKHAAYEVTDVEKIFQERMINDNNTRCPESHAAPKESFHSDEIRGT